MRFTHFVQNVSAGLSSLHRGTAFEKRALALLQSTMSMSLTRVGGKSDGGVDLIGWWWLPEVGLQASLGMFKPVLAVLLSLISLDDCVESSPRRRIRILGQCKAEKKKMGPNYVRELEGVVYKYTSEIRRLSNKSPHDVAASLNDHRVLPELDMRDFLVDLSVENTYRNPRHSTSFPIVAVLVSESSFTQACLLTAHASPVPLFLLHLPPYEQQSIPDGFDASYGPIGTLYWNAALSSSRGLLGTDFEIRWERKPSETGEVIRGIPRLWFGGKRLPHWTPHWTPGMDNPTEPQNASS